MFGPCFFLLKFANEKGKSKICSVSVFKSEDLSKKNHYDVLCAVWRISVKKENNDKTYCFSFSQTCHILGMTI